MRSPASLLPPNSGVSACCKATSDCAKARPVPWGTFARVSFTGDILQERPGGGAGRGAGGGVNSNKRAAGPNSLQPGSDSAQRPKSQPASLRPVGLLIRPQTESSQAAEYQHPVLVGSTANKTLLDPLTPGDAEGGPSWVRRCSCAGWRTGKESEDKRESPEWLGEGSAV